MTYFRILTNNDLITYQQLLLNILNKSDDVFTWGIYDYEIASEDNLTHNLSQDNNNCTIIGAFIDGQLIGATTLYNIKIHGLAHKIFLENMGIIANDNDTRKEIATALLNQVFQYCQKQDIEFLLASVASNNITAKVFFSDLDFEVLALEQHARKYNSHYVDQHWLVYHIKEIPS